MTAHDDGDGRLPGPEDLTILVVDDDRVDRRRVERSIRKRGIANPIVEARDGFEALEYLTGRIAGLNWPYLVLLDINMPRMSGLELLDRLRSDDSLCDIVVFVLTTSDDERDLARAYAHQIAGYVVKADAGADFLNLVAMLEKFTLTVRFPASRQMVTGVVHHAERVR